MNHPHLHKVLNNIPPIDPKANIALLIGRDLPQAHHILEQVIGPPTAPFAQLLPLGWVIIGDVCLNKKHAPSVVRVNKTQVRETTKGTIFDPCPNALEIREIDSLGARVFEKTKDDEKVGMSVEDKKFMNIMDEHCKKNTEGHWSAPLPLKTEHLGADNREQALSHAHAL